jgi:hypothetical protein
LVDTGITRRGWKDENGRIYGSGQKKTEARQCDNGKVQQSNPTAVEWTGTHVVLSVLSHQVVVMKHRRWTICTIWRRFWTEGFGKHPVDEVKGF